MSKKSMCNLCANKTTDNGCKDCNAGEYNNFFPKSDIKKYFHYGYSGPGKGSYYFNTTNEELKPTQSVLIKGTHYCPYCAKPSYCIQEKDSLAVIGHCCICDGALAELEFESKKAELKQAHEKQMYDLACEYTDMLTFDMEQLFAIKQQQEKRSFEFHNHKKSSAYADRKSIVTTIDELL